MSVKGWGAAVKKITRIRRIVEEAPQKAASDWIEQDFKPAAKALAPVRTGELRDSIDGRVTKTQATVFAAAPHAGFVENGTSLSPAQPYMEPALAQTKPKLKARIEAELKKAR